MCRPEPPDDMRPRQVSRLADRLGARRTGRRLGRSAAHSPNGQADRVMLSDCSRPAGFTLIEMLTAMVLLTMVLTLVYGAFFQLSGHALRLQQRLESQQELRLMLRLISDDLRSSQWLVHFWEQPRNPRTGIVADTESIAADRFTRISFHAAVPARFHRQVAAAQDPGLHELGYRVQRNEQTESLELLRREDFYLDDDLENGGVEVVLADNIAAFLLEFLEPPTSGGNGAEDWLQRWDSPSHNEGSRMPIAVRLTLGRRTPSGEVVQEAMEFNVPAGMKRGP